MEKDVTEKILVDYNDVFADIMNVLLFDGERVVCEDELEGAGTVSQYKFLGTVRPQDRDSAKFWKNAKIVIAFLGMENQTEVDSDMPFRVIGYDGAMYRGQLDSKGSRYPVVTLVLYFGDKHWGEKQRSLHGQLDVPEPLKPYVSDYRINVFEIAWLDDETVGKFRSDFRLVAEYFVQKRKNQNYNPSSQELRHVEATLACLSAVSGDGALLEVFEEAQREGRSVSNMCEMIERIKNEGRAEGMEKGMEKKLVTLVLRMRDKDYTVDQIADVTDESPERIREIISSGRELA